MNQDTQRAVEDIRSRRWCLTNQGLGEGGWPAVMKFASDWKLYELIHGGEVLSAIRAESDEVAIQSFRDRFFVGGCRVHEKIVTYREIELS